MNRCTDPKESEREDRVCLYALWMRSLQQPIKLEGFQVMEVEQLLKEKREEILDIARRHGAKNIRLFGSVARGEAGESSDIDMLVEVGDDPSPWFPGGLIADLEELLGRHVHAVTVGGLHSYVPGTSIARGSSIVSWFGGEDWLYE